MIDRFLNFLKMEWNDFMGNYKEETKDKKTEDKKSEESLFNQFYEHFIKSNKQTSNQQDKQKAYQQYQKYKQQQQQQKQQQNMINEAKYYDALEIKPGLGFEEIKNAYKKAMKKYHPDKFVNDPEKRKYAELLSQKINEAFAYFEKKYGQK